MKKPNVTVVIAVKNMKNTIRKCLDSVLNTDYERKKILVGDGKSTDGTLEILKEYESKGLIDLMEPKSPVNNQWNEALRIVDTEYIAFTDADCEVDKKWLTHLINAFKVSDEIIATAGFCGTPENVSWLSKIIGKELEHRFDNFPRYISRAPTMNLCVKTAYAKKVGFRKELHTSSEVVFGWELSNLGKILYVPRARVVHHHRSTLSGFFKQQRLYARYLFKIIFDLGYRFRGDHISTQNMILQVPLLETIILGMVCDGYVMRTIALFATIWLFYLYYKTFNEIEVKESLFFATILFCFIRTIAWTVGTLQGLFDLIIKKGGIINE
jgi:glycosyltransferase involved in cell wall biosynthesis